ncbi:MAG: AraC family transcriptional regulator [Lachnospiraceae bacterium]
MTNEPEKNLSYTGDSRRYPGIPLALDGIGISHLQEHVDRPVGIPCYQWIQTLSGCGRLWIEEQVYSVEPGHGIFIPRDTPHIYYSAGDPWVVNYLCFSGETVGEILQSLSIVTAGVYFVEQSEHLLLLEDRIFELAKLPSHRHSIEISKILYSILLDLSTDIRHLGTSLHPGKNELAHYIIQYLHEHQSEPFSLADLSSDCGRSKEYLCQTFKTSTGFTILNYMIQIRIASAKFLLLDPNTYTVNEIAKKCGFESTSYFCAVFKRETKMTPETFRRQSE